MIAIHNNILVNIFALISSKGNRETNILMFVHTCINVISIVYLATSFQFIENII